MDKKNFTKFSGIAGLRGPSLPVGAEICGGSNFEGSGGQNFQKCHLGLRVGRFKRVCDILCSRDF